MKRFILSVTVSVFIIIALVTSCTHKPQITVVKPDGNYPDSVAAIFLNKCTNAGCHNQASYQNAGELLLDTWDHLFLGGVSGAVVVAYSVKFSPLLYYVCPNSGLGFTVNDPGHLTAPLSTAEYKTLANWVANGAPDKNGNVPFASNAATRQKIYLTVQGCGLIAVIDGKSRQVMRYITVGDAYNQSPHDVEISADGKYAYVPFYVGSNIQKIDVQTDTVIGSVNASSITATGTGCGWSIIALSPLDTEFLVSGYLSNCIAAVNTSSLKINNNLSLGNSNGGGPFTSLIPYPHGLAANATFDTFYTTTATNVLKYAFIMGVPVYSSPIPASGAPHQIEMSPDNSKYFVTCPDPTNVSNNYLRVYDRHTDKLIKAIQVGAWPQEMDISPSKNYLFVACMEDKSNPRPNSRGSIYVFDMNTLDTVRVLYGDFFQPHDITVDEQDGIFVIPSRNADTAGPAPHHVTSCDGRPGWYSVYNLNTLAPESNKRYEVSVDPYAISTRFK